MEILRPRGTRFPHLWRQRDDHPMTANRCRPRARASFCSSSDPRNSPSGRDARSDCFSRTRPSGTRINRCSQRAFAPTTWQLWRIPSRAEPRSFSVWKCGAALPSTPRCASCTRIRGTVCATCASGFLISASRCSCADRMPLAIRTTRQMSSPASSNTPPSAAWISSAFSIR